MADAICRTLVAHVRESSAPARMDSGRPAVELALRSGKLLPAHGQQRVADAGHGGVWSRFTTAATDRRCALPFLLLWICRAIDRMADQPHSARGREVRPVADQQRELRLIARRTWRFFETFVTAEDNHLPPDNFQEDPNAVVAHRTSPTNIGLYLLSTVAARDFGWCGLRDALDRIEATLGTMVRMHKLSWAPLQLVRHARPASARTPLRVVGRLGQPRRASHHARGRVPRVAERRRAHPRRPSTASPIRSI